MKKGSKGKVLVAMSGGVDSSVAAALLVKQGYEVIGAFMKQWSNSPDLYGVCQWKQDRRDALRVAARLGISLLTLDFEKEYRHWVTKYMFAEYKKGRTPNPDVVCNKYIKFGVWLDRARELGFDFLATGHYAYITENTPASQPVARPSLGFGSVAPVSSAGKENTKTQKTLFCLVQAIDKDKDQTYFLHQLTQDQLHHVLFPIGEYKKSQVRALARKFNLPTAEREESMGICFVGEVPMKEFLQQKIKQTPGDIVVLRPGSGLTDVIGQHEGLAFYTIGQRHFKQSPPPTRGRRGGGQRSVESRPLYVLEKRQKTNELVVGYEDDPLLYKNEIDVGDVHWITGLLPKFPLKCEVRLRHRQPLQNAVIKKTKKQKSKKTVIVEFEKPQRAVTPGQFAVFYLPRGERQRALRGEGECLGGGVIL